MRHDPPHVKHPHAFLLVGKESFLKKEFIRSLRERFFPKQTDAALNFQEFVVSENSLAAWMDFAQTAPFLSEKRLAVLWGIDDLDETGQKTLLSHLARPPAASVLVFVSEEGSAKKSGFLKELAFFCQLTACHAPFEKDLPQLVEHRVRSRKATIQKDAAYLLIERAG